MLCTGSLNMEKLFSSNAPLKAVRDFACEFYYKDQIVASNLDFGKIFNTGFLVLGKQLLEHTSYDALMSSLESEGASYDGGDQGYLNWYIQTHGVAFEHLDVTYNYALDYHYPFRSKLPKVIHFTGTKPWLDGGGSGKGLVDRFFYDGAHRVMRHLLDEVRSSGLNDVRFMVSRDVRIGWCIRMSHKVLGRLHRWTLGRLVQWMKLKYIKRTTG
jgi:hypothetical protein